MMNPPSTCSAGCFRCTLALSRGRRFYHCAPERTTSVYNLLDSCWKQLSKNKLAIRRVGTYFLSPVFNKPRRTKVFNKPRRTNTLQQNCWPELSFWSSSSFSSSQYSSGPSFSSASSSTSSSSSSSSLSWFTALSNTTFASLLTSILCWPSRSRVTSCQSQPKQSASTFATGLLPSVFARTIRSTTISIRRWVGLNPRVDGASSTNPKNLSIRQVRSIANPK